MPARAKSRPLLNLWFGNFFEPFYSDREAAKRGIADVADLGFTSVNFDAKPWEDYFARYRGEPASPYVSMQEMMIEETAKHGLAYNFLALYLCGDNLYPAIRDVPPVRGEDSILPDGRSMGTYKYWSPKAQATMVEHVKGLLRLYGERCCRRPDGRIVLMTMFDPIAKPSFDDEGRAHYLDWLEKRYGGDVAKLNARYGTAVKAVGELAAGNYWLRPEELNWVGCARPTADDFVSRTPDFWRWIDNQTYLAGVMEDYFATMKKHWRALEQPVFIEPNLHQWGYFFNPPSQRDWQTGQRALDVYRCAEHVDGALFVAAPINAEDRADAMALSVEASIMRGANHGRRFTGGLYLGRHINGNIYRVVPPAEAIATLVANGADALYAYGYSGLDDGGVLFRMDEVFRDSLRAGNRWATEVIPLLDAPRAKDVAILFPAEMSLYEPLEVDEGGRHRMDLLGWYQQFTDLGWCVDIVHPDQVVAGALRDYRFLVVPHNSLYDLGDNGALEASVKKFVEDGGAVFHGPHCHLAQKAFGIEETPVDFDCIEWDEEIIPHGWSTVAFQGGEVLGHYIQSGLPGITRRMLGKGHVYSVGFQYGYSYSRRTMPIVPPAYGKREMHPIILLKETPIEAIAGKCPGLPMAPMRGFEFGRFREKWVIVNHRSSPVRMDGIDPERAIHLVPSAPGWIAGHSAIVVV